MRRIPKVHGPRRSVRHDYAGFKRWRNTPWYRRGRGGPNAGGNVLHAGDARRNDIGSRHRHDITFTAGITPAPVARTSRCPENRSAADSPRHSLACVGSRRSGSHTGLERKPGRGPLPGGIYGGRGWVITGHRSVFGAATDYLRWPGSWTLGQFGCGPERHQIAGGPYRCHACRGRPRCLTPVRSFKLFPLGACRGNRSGRSVNAPMGDLWHAVQRVGMGQENRRYSLVYDRVGGRKCCFGVASASSLRPRGSRERNARCVLAPSWAHVESDTPRSERFLAPDRCLSMVGGQCTDCGWRSCSGSRHLGAGSPMRWRRVCRDRDSCDRKASPGRTPWWSAGINGSGASGNGRVSTSQEAESATPVTLQQQDRLNPQPWRANYLQLRALRAQLSARLAQRWQATGGISALDVGCGERPYETLLAQYADHYVGVDTSAGPKVDVVASAESLPFAAETFDCVLCTQVLQYVEEPMRAVAEMRRVMRSSGLLLLSTHGVSFVERLASDQWRWTHNGLKSLLNRAGEWRSIDILPAGGVFSAIAYLLGGELEFATYHLRVPAAAAVPCFCLNVGAWRLDRVIRQRFPHLEPDAATNYVVAAQRA